MSALHFGSFKDLWQVFLLFTIPVGGGMPAGILLAKTRGLGWFPMTTLYFISDVCLALVFEPFMMLLVKASKRFRFLAILRESFQKTTQKVLDGYGGKPGPFLLVAIAFGADPMTGRAAALAVGHNFITGWAIAIAGDMIFFGVIAASTLLLNNILGNGTLTAIIILILMLGVPSLIRKIRIRFEL